LQNRQHGQAAEGDSEHQRPHAAGVCTSARDTATLKTIAARWLLAIAGEKLLLRETQQGNITPR